MVTPTDPFGDGRDQGGRFAKGNRGGPGNPLAKQTAKLRSALLNAVSEEDIREVVNALLAEAKAGNVQAVRELLDRCLGKPEAFDTTERLEALETLLEALTGRPA